jgi:hypothetical protein
MKRTLTALALAALLAACGAPEPVPPPDYSDAEQVLEDTATTVTTRAGSDPQLASCTEVKAKGLGPYTADDPEFGWYDDRDGDGTVCE